MRIGFVILAHDQPDNVRRLVTRLTAQQGLVSLHWDRRHPVDLPAELQRDLPHRQASLVLAAERIKVHWGLWSVVEATLNGLKAIAASGHKVDYVILLSGHDYPLRPLDQLRAFFASHPGIEHIEAVNHEKEKWVTDGLHDERWQYRHYTSWRNDKKLFDRIWKFQRSLGLKVRPPHGLKPHFGSQWWALSWPTLQKIMAKAEDPSIRRFFRRTWVPDEMFFQTMVAHLAPASVISRGGLGFHHFSRQGLPLIFFRDHFDFLKSQPHFFARKLAPRAGALRDALDALADQRRTEPPPPRPLRKRLGSYEHFISLQWRGLPGRRILGRQKDNWWGDLEWNKRPYIVLLAPHGMDLGNLQAALARDRSKACYGDLFHAGIIDYGPHAKPHPLYPARNTSARDQKRPNFLVDLLSFNAPRTVVFTLRLPCHTEMPKIVLYDHHATLLLVEPEETLINEKSGTIQWNKAFDTMVWQDYLAEVQQAKRPYRRISFADIADPRVLQETVADLAGTDRLKANRATTSDSTPRITTLTTRPAKAAVVS